MSKYSKVGLEGLYDQMRESKKIFFEALTEYLREHGKACVGSKIKSVCSTHRNRSFIVIDVEPAISRFDVGLELRPTYRASLLDGKGKTIPFKICKFKDEDFEVLER